MKKDKNSIEYHLANYIEESIGHLRIAKEIISSGENFAVFKSRIYDEISDYLNSKEGIKNYGLLGSKLIDIQMVTNYLINDSFEKWFNKEYKDFNQISDDSSLNSSEINSDNDSENDSDNDSDNDSEKDSDNDSDNDSNNNSENDSENDSDNDSENELNFQENIDMNNKFIKYKGDIDIGSSCENLHDYVVPFYIYLKHFEKLNEFKNQESFEKQIFHSKIIDKICYDSDCDNSDSDDSNSDDFDKNHYILEKLEIEKKNSLYYISSIGNNLHNNYIFSEEQMEKIYQSINKEKIHIYELNINDGKKKKIFQIKNDKMIFMQCSFINNFDYHFYQFNINNYSNKILIDISLSSELYLYHNIQLLQEYLENKLKLSPSDYIIRMDTMEYIQYFVGKGFSAIGVSNGDNNSINFYFERNNF
jgi:hypothetical protein